VVDKPAALLEVSPGAGRVARRPAALEAAQDDGIEGDQSNAGKAVRMKHLNHCRQMVRQFSDSLLIPNLPQQSREILSHCIDLAKASQKFLLPDGGLLYDDKELRALDESERLSLPFPLVALEFSRTSEFISTRPKNLRTDVYQPNKSLVFARERVEVIAITVVVWNENAGIWGPLPEVAIPRIGYLKRDRKNEYGRVPVAIISNPKNHMIPNEDYMDEVAALMSMLNILSCRNVHIEQSHPGKTQRAMTNGRKGALKFDSYHVLMVDAPTNVIDSGIRGHSHRSPREHLRRGHIRRIADGRRIWVNAAVVGAGRGAGVITKDYAMRCAA
jgi:hypothetical protein